jgi:hypothetical protein
MWWRRVRWLLTLIALCSIATCPSAKRACTAKNQAQEADDLVNVLGDRVAQIATTTGKVPPTPAGPTPQPSCCDQGGACAPDANLWSAQGWRDLQFSVDGPYRYTYQYIPDANGQGATIRATGDLDCDGVPSVYELKLTLQNGSVRRAWRRQNPYE